MMSSNKRNTYASLALLLLYINLLFISTLEATSAGNGCDNPPASPTNKPKHHKSKHHHKHHKSTESSPPSPPKLPLPTPPKPYISPLPPLPFVPSPPKSSSPPKTSPPKPFFPLPPKPSFPLPPKPYFPTPPLTPYITPPKMETCPRDALKLEVCSSVLGGLVGIISGTPPKKPCCRLFGGLMDLEAAVCLCTAIKANVLGLNLDVPLSLSLVLNVCDRSVPPGFQCT